MKKFTLSTLVTISVLACISCERHKWENSAEGVKDGTKNLFHAEEKHDEHKEDSHGKANKNADKAHSKPKGAH